MTILLMNIMRNHWISSPLGALNIDETINDGFVSRNQQVHVGFNSLTIAHHQEWMCSTKYKSPKIVLANTNWMMITSFQPTKHAFQPSKTGIDDQQRPQLVCSSQELSLVTSQHEDVNQQRWDDIVNELVSDVEGKCRKLWFLLSNKNLGFSCKCPLKPWRVRPTLSCYWDHSTGFVFRVYLGRCIKSQYVASQ